MDFVNALKPYTYKWDKRAKYIDKTDVTTKDIDKAIKFANDCATNVVQLKGVNTIK